MLEIQEGSFNHACADHDSFKQRAPLTLPERDPPVVSRVALEASRPVPVRDIHLTYFLKVSFKTNHFAVNHFYCIDQLRILSKKCFLLYKI